MTHLVRRSPRARLFRLLHHGVWLLLALSVLFNVFFVVGYARARSMAVDTLDTETASRLVRGELDLERPQADLFGELRAEMRQEQALVRDSLRDVKQQFWDEMRKATPNPDRLVELIDQELELERRFRLGAAERLCRFAESLSPEKRDALFDRLSRGDRRGRYGRGHGDMMRRMKERFDRDGDGRLSPEERDEAHRAMSQRREQMLQRRQQMFERFDTDGDGVLDAEERAAADAFRRSRRDGG